MAATQKVKKQTKKVPYDSAIPLLEITQMG